MSKRFLISSRKPFAVRRGAEEGGKGPVPPQCSPDVVGIAILESVPDHRFEADGRPVPLKKAAIARCVSVGRSICGT